jgi:cytochrome c-type biogenesis protein CcmH/NrfG
MRRTAFRLVLLGVLFATPAWCAWQAPQNPPASPPPSSPAPPSQDKPTPKRDIATFDPPSAENDVDVGSYYMRKGDVNAAIPRFQEAVQLKPNYGKARLLLAGAYEKAHDKTAAAKAYEDYLKTFPNAPDAKKIRKKIEKLTGE